MCTPTYRRHWSILANHVNLFYWTLFRNAGHEEKLLDRNTKQETHTIMYGECAGMMALFSVDHGRAP